MRNRLLHQWGLKGMWSSGKMGLLACQIVAEEQYELLPGANAHNVAVALWLFYDSYCEYFDRLVCTGIRDSYEGPVAWPLTPEERRAIDRHARVQRECLRLRAERLGISPEIIKRAKRSDARYRADAQRGRSWNPHPHQYRR